LSVHREPVPQRLRKAKLGIHISKTRFDKLSGDLIERLIEEGGERSQLNELGFSEIPFPGHFGKRAFVLIHN